MTDPDPINWGILSTARIGVTAFIPSARATPGARVHAVASRSREKADAFAREHDIPLALGGYQALVEHPEIDAIYISLPNSLHAEWTIAAARAGKHVFCEKPLAVTAAEGRRMAAACPRRRGPCSSRLSSSCTTPRAGASWTSSGQGRSAPCATSTRAWPLSSTIRPTSA